jgi:hypothetical protein
MLNENFKKNVKADPTYPNIAASIFQHSVQNKVGIKLQIEVPS